LNFFYDNRNSFPWISQTMLIYLYEATSVALAVKRKMLENIDRYGHNLLRRPFPVLVAPERPYLNDLWQCVMHPFQHARRRFNRARVTPRVLVISDLTDSPERPRVVELAEIGDQACHRQLPGHIAQAPPQALDQQPIERIP
jgi:hypothetical protein